VDLYGKQEVARANENDLSNSCRGNSGSRMNVDLLPPSLADYRDVEALALEDHYVEGTALRVGDLAQGLVMFERTHGRGDKVDRER